MAEKNAKIREKFLSLFKIAFATGEANSRGDKSAIKKQERDYEQLKFFVNGLKKTDEIDACLDQYIKVYTAYFPSDRRSKFMFALLIEHRIDASKEDDTFIEAISHMLSDNQRPLRSAIRQRYEDLEDREKREIQVALKDKKQRKKERSTILDALRTAFYNARDKTATLADLLTFNPVPDKDLEQQFHTFRRNCDIPWSEKDAEGIEEALKAFMAFLNGQRDPLKLFQIVKWGRDIVRGNTLKVVNKAGNPITITTPADVLDCELYFQSVYWLFRYAIDHGYSRNYSGYSPEEEDFFFGPLSSFYYYPNWLNRYKKAAIKEADRFRDASVLFLQLLIFARINNAILVNDQEARRIKKIRETTPEGVLRKKSFSLDVGRESFRGNVHIGARAGKVILIYFDQIKNSTSRDLYVEFVGLTNVLFKVSKGTWAHFNEESFYTTLWMNTRHLLVLIPAMLTFLGYTFSFITGGFSALIMDVGIDIGVGEIAEQADLGPGATMLLQLAASVIVPGASRYAKAKYEGIGKPKVEVKASDQSLNRGLGGVADDARALKSVDNFVDAEARGVAQPREPMVGDIITTPVLDGPGRIKAIMPNGDMVVQPIMRPPVRGGVLPKTVQPTGSTAIEPFDPRTRFGGGQSTSKGGVGTPPWAPGGTQTLHVEQRLTQGKENFVGMEAKAVENPQKGQPGRSSLSTASDKAILDTEATYNAAFGRGTIVLPGPAEHFPFGSGREPMPRPEVPDRLYRIMSIGEWLETSRTRKLQAGSAAAMSYKYLSLDSKYPMLFREKELEDLAEGSGKRVESEGKNLRMLKKRLTEVEATGDTAYARKLRERLSALRSEIEQAALETKAEAEDIIGDWFAAPGQKVVVEVELVPGAIEYMLNRAVPESLIRQYQGQNVFILKFERGYGRNIAIPPWQLDNFNQAVVRIRLYAERGLNLFGRTQTPKGPN